MNKTQAFKIIILSVLCAWIFDLFLGRTLSAKISTLPVLNRLKIISPQAPIVINTREVIRTNGDQSASASGIRSKLSILAAISENGISFLAGAVNLTSDGYFATGVMPEKLPQNLVVILSDGKSAKVSAVVPDPAAGLTFLKADLSSVPVAPLGQSSKISPGEQVIFAANSLQSHASKIAVSYVSAAQPDVAGEILSSDYYSRSFAVQAAPGLATGQAAVDSQGEIIGIWNGSAITSSDVLKQELDAYFNNGGKFSRPAFGFSYQIAGTAESGLLGQPEGARVTTVKNSLPAQKAGLLADDVIISVNGQKIFQDSQLEEILERIKPGDAAKISVYRGGKIFDVDITAGELK